MEASLPMFVIFQHFELIRKVFPAIPTWLRTWINPKMAGLTRLQHLLSAQAKEATSSPYSMLEAPHRIIYNELLSPDARDGREVPNVTSLTQEAQALVLNGTDTTANVLLLGVFYLLEQPALVGRLRKELLDIWPALRNTPPTFKELEKLPFLVSDCAVGLLNISNWHGNRLQ